MLKKLRVALAWVFWIGITLLLLDFTGALHGYLGWMAKIQFLPAVLALNAGVIVGLVLLTLVFGRVYCSVICPLGIFQDGVAWLRAHREKNPYKYHKEAKWLRYGVWVLFVAALIAGVNVIVSLLAPYSAYGRMVQNLLQPLYLWGNNALAFLSERAGNYTFYTREVWLRSLPTFLVALATLIILAITAFKGGRAYCNGVCPVGTTLSFFSRFAMFRPVIDESKCVRCRSCELNCKARCIEITKESAKIDYSRCVDCFNCIDHCKAGGLKYRFAWGKPRKVSEAEGSPEAFARTGSRSQVPEAEGSPEAFARTGSRSQVPEAKGSLEAFARIGSRSDASGEPSASGAQGRRAFIAGSAITLGAVALKSVDAKAQAVAKMDGGLADVLPKTAPEREVPLTPPGSKSVKDFYRHCTACQLCVAECPNNVLRPSGDLEHLMQPEMNYEKGFCRPECTRCSELCPTGAIRKISREQKTQFHIGTARVNPDTCLMATGKSACGKCVQACPSGAVKLVKTDDGFRIPVIAEAICTGCGACEYLCPVRPISAITVNGRYSHEA